MICSDVFVGDAIPPNCRPKRPSRI
jgi:hypothetical protein